MTKSGCLTDFWFFDFFLVSWNVVGQNAKKETSACTYNQVIEQNEGWRKQEQQQQQQISRDGTLGLMGGPLLRRSPVYYVSGNEKGEVES